MATSTNASPHALQHKGRPHFDTSQVAGNAPEEIKRVLGDPRTFFASFLKPGERPLNGFRKDIMERMTVTELSILQKAEEPQKMEGRAVLEVDVSEGTHASCLCLCLTCFAARGRIMRMNDLIKYGRYGQWRR